MTEEGFRNGPARQRPLESFSDRPNEPTPSNPLGQSDRDLEEARRLRAGRDNQARIERAIDELAAPALPEDRNARILIEPMLQFFDGGALLSPVVGMYRKLAEAIVNRLPRNPERTVALRKLLESRDSAIRAMGMKS